MGGSPIHRCSNMNERQLKSVLLGCIRKRLGIHLSSSNQKKYNGSRRKSACAKKHRIGPAPMDNTPVSGMTQSNLPGILDDTADDVSCAMSTTGMAGNQALLTYFHRLASSTDANETIDFAFLLSLLNAGGDLNFTDRYGQTILHAISRDWHPDVAAFVIERGASLNKTDKYGRTPLHLASAVGHIDMIKYLISKGANIQARTYGEHQTPLHYAAKNNTIDSVKTLILLGAKISDRDYKNRTPLFLTTELGRIEASRYLLDLGVPAGVYDTLGNSCIAIMVEKMPSVAYEAMSQFYSENKEQGVKKYFLNYFEFNPSRHHKAKFTQTALELIVKNKKLDLLGHPVIQKLIKIKWDLFGKKYIIAYFVLNMVYTLFWTVMSIYLSVLGHSESTDWWRFIMPCIVTILSIGFAIEQVVIMKRTQNDDAAWRDWRIQSLKLDYRYCHPTWPDERRFLELEVQHLMSMRSEYFKQPWHFFEWLCLLSATVALVTRVHQAVIHTDNSDYAVKISMTVTILIMWIRMMNVCRGFQISGQFVAVLGFLSSSVLQFTFLFVDLFIPFCIIFWILFGGDENAMLMLSHGLPPFCETIDGLVYFIWALLVGSQFPLASLEVVDKVVADTTVSLVFFILTFVCLNLFISLLQQVFASIYSRAKQYATLEQAKIILWAEKVMNQTAIQREFMTQHCSPLVEDLSEKDAAHPLSRQLEISHARIRRQVNTIVDLHKERKKFSGEEERLLLLKEIREDVDRVQSKLGDWDSIMTALQKIELDNKKLVRLFDKSGTKDGKESIRKRSAKK